jgi:hypothetical protein
MPQISTHDKDPSSGRHSSVSKWDLKADEAGPWIAETCSFMSVQVAGEFGGGKCVLEGTNDKTIKPCNLSYQFDDDLSFSSSGMKNCRIIPKFIRPRIEGGDQETLITVIIYMVS